jgi:hypothetical protein
MMKYFLRIWALGRNPEIVIDEKQFNDLKQAKNLLSEALAIEEKYELLISNYLDLEKECLNITSEYMVKNATTYADFFDIRLTLNRRIVNLLTSTKSYIDQIQHHAKACIPANAEIAKNVKSLFSNEYDLHFEYRFMEALRNYVQHRGLAVHSTSSGGKRISQDNDHMREFRTSLYTLKSEVEFDPAFKANVTAEMPDKVNLMYAARVYVSSISKVHREIRNMITDNSQAAREMISHSINEYATINNGISLGLHAISANLRSPRDSATHSSNIRPPVPR